MPFFLDDYFLMRSDVTSPVALNATTKRRKHLQPGKKSRFALLTRVVTLTKMAGVAGLEPVTSAVTGQRSNQLSYTPAKGNVTIRNVFRMVKR
jgi:hypothetical protein